jgi:hypothetical protein
MGVLCFERIESPLDQANVAAQSIFPLRELELAANVAVAVRKKNGGHMGMQVDGVAADSNKGFGESDHPFTIEGAEDLATRVMGDDEGDVGLGFEFGVTPDFTGDFDAAPEFVERMQGADRDVWRHGSLF